jgi:ubiquinone/menaquinone biosynthesis C-methylase UbiE
MSGWVGHRLAVLLVVALWLACAAPHAPLAPAKPRPHAHPHAHPHEHAHPNVHHGHRSPEAFARYAASMDRSARDAWQKPEALLDALAIAPGNVVADIGAGTGYFTFRLARRVGASGRVVATDVDDRFLAMLRARAAREGSTNVESRKTATDAPGLAHRSVDAVFICNTYHHIDDRLAWLRKLRGALRSGARVIHVDFHKRPLPVGPPESHKLTPADVTREMTTAGFALEKTIDFLPYQYVLVFRVDPAR